MPTRCSAESEKRLNLCVPGGKETSRMLKQLAQEIEPARRAAAPAADAATAAERCHAETAAVRATIPTEATFPLAPPAQQGRLRQRRPGMSSSISAPAGLDYVVGDTFGIFPATIPLWSIRSSPRFTRRPDFPIGDRTLREELTDDVSLVARAGQAVPAVLLSSPAASAGRRRARSRRRGPGRRRRDPRRARGACTNSPGVRPDPEAFIECARSAAAAALFDLVVAEGQTAAACR